MTRQQLNPWRTAGSGRGVVDTSDSLSTTERPGRLDGASSLPQQQRSRKRLDGRRPRRRSTMKTRMPALFVLLWLAVVLLAVPSCRAGKDKVVSNEPTALLPPPPPPVAAPALVPIPNADDYGDDDNDDNNNNGDDPAAAQGPGGQGGGGGPNGSGGATGGGPGGAPTDDAATGGDDKGVNAGGTTTTAAPTSAPVAASGGSSGGGTSTTTTTTYSVSLPIMELDLVLATATSDAGQGSARRLHERRQQVRQNERRLAANGTATTGAATSVNADILDAALEDFLQTFLERSHRDTLQRVQLVTSVDSYQSTTGVAHVTASDGTATFKGEQVQQTDLADTIATYLSFWGVQDLISALHDHAGLNVLALNVTLDGVPVQPQVQVVNTGDGTTTSNGNTGGSDGTGDSGTSESSSSSMSKSKDNSTLIVVIAVLGTLAVLLLAGTLWIVLKRRNSRAQLQVNKRLGGGMDSLDGYVRRGGNEDDDDTQSYSPRPSSGRGSPSRFRILGTASAGSKSNLSTPNASPSRLSRAMSDDFRSLSGVVSVEESIFTSADAGGGTGTGRSVGGDVVVVRETSACSSNSYLQYDPSRLDHVISSARGMAGQQRKQQQQKGTDPEADLSA
jgi:hypothetical protein